MTDIKYIGGDVAWTLPFGDHYLNTDSHLSFSTQSELNEKSSGTIALYDTIAKTYGLDVFSTKKNVHSNGSGIHTADPKWMNSGVLFTDKTIDSSFDWEKSDFRDEHHHTFCYLCSINQHQHAKTKPRDPAQRRHLIPYKNPKALKTKSVIEQDTQELPYDLIPYRFIVRTGNKTNAGTRAQVYLYMYGTELNWESINLRAKNKQDSVIDGFPAGSIRSFCLKGPDIGHLTSLTVNMVGAKTEKDWFLREIEITNLKTSITWLATFNCWLPKNISDDERVVVKPIQQITSTITPENLSVYVLEIRTGDKAFAGTDSTIQVSVRGSTGDIRRLALTTKHSDLYERNQIDTFAIVGSDIGEPKELTIDSDYSQFASDWDLKEIVLSKILPSDFLKYYFQFNTWLGKETGTLRKKSEKFPSMKLTGPIFYHLTIKTGNRPNAGTDANVSIMIYGENGRTTIHNLDTKLKNDFERGSTNEFDIVDTDVGQIEKIKIWHDNTGVGPGWFLDSIKIRKIYSSGGRIISDIFTERVITIGAALNRRVQKQLKKSFEIHTTNTDSNERQQRKHQNTIDESNRPKSVDRFSARSNLRENILRQEHSKHTTSHREYDNESMSSNDHRSILRSPALEKFHSKKVTWDEQSIGSGQDISVDTKKMKELQKRIEKNQQEQIINSGGGRSKSITSTRTASPISVSAVSGHFAHQAYWISSHSFDNNKWKIKSIEENDPVDLDSTMCLHLLSDRSATKMKSSKLDIEDDIYEFVANRWLAKDEGDKKVEVYLTPKTVILSKASKNVQLEQHNKLHSTEDFSDKHRSSEHLKKHSREETFHSHQIEQKSHKPLEKIDQRHPEETSKSFKNIPEKISRSQPLENRSHRTLEMDTEKDDLKKYHDRPVSRQHLTMPEKISHSEQLISGRRFENDSLTSDKQKGLPKNLKNKPELERISHSQPSFYRQFDNDKTSPRSINDHGVSSLHHKHLTSEPTLRKSDKSSYDLNERPTSSHHFKNVPDKLSHSVPLDRNKPLENPKSHFDTDIDLRQLNQASPRQLSSSSRLLSDIHSPKLSPLSTNVNKENLMHRTNPTSTRETSDHNLRQPHLLKNSDTDLSYRTTQRQTTSSSNQSINKSLSQRSSKEQVYNSAYGTLPLDDF